jgi:putative transposase
VELALELPEMSPRELAWHVTDSQGVFISKSSVYRILKSYDLVTSPAYIVMATADELTLKTRRVHEFWQTDFTYLEVSGSGWYYLSTILDDYNRYIITCKLTQTMSADDVKDILDIAIKLSGVEKVKLCH